MGTEAGSQSTDWDITINNKFSNNKNMHLNVKVWKKHVLLYWSVPVAHGIKL
jgi:hypothetical protein